MTQPEFLDLEIVCAIHKSGLEDHGGQDGVRDMASLESAVAHPENIWFYGQGDLFEVAAGYAFHIAEAQAFFDGNKRAGMGAALAFLDGNGWEVNADARQLHSAMIDIANHRLDRTGLAAILRNSASRL